MAAINFWLGCEIPPAKNPSSGKFLSQNPSTEKSLPAKSLHRKIPLSKIFLGKMPTSKIPLEIKSLLMDFSYVDSIEKGINVSVYQNSASMETNH